MHIEKESLILSITSNELNNINKIINKSKAIFSTFFINLIYSINLTILKKVCIISLDLGGIMSKRRIIIMICIIILFILAIVFSFYYYKGKYVVSFETGTDDAILNQYVEKNSKVKKPIEPTKEGYVFIEWQLNGKTYDFESLVTKNITLNAKWKKEEYITVKFETLTDERLDNIKLLKGSYIQDLPILTREGYKFKGWQMNNIEYINQELYDDITLTAIYEKIKNISVGDYVLITGDYASSSSSISADNSLAIGWTRRVLEIYEGSNYPYMVGNSSGVTGFFKEDALELK